MPDTAQIKKITNNCLFVVYSSVAAAATENPIPVNEMQEKPIHTVAEKPIQTVAENPIQTVAEKPIPVEAVRKKRILSERKLRDFAQFEKTGGHQQPDPLITYMRNDVQSMLNRLTTIDLPKMARLRTTTVIQTPQIQLMPERTLRKVGITKMYSSLGVS